MNMLPLLSVKDLCCSYNGSTVLSQVSFEVARGSFISLVGPNGAGKSSLLRALMRLIKARSGKIALNGIDLDNYTQEELARIVSYVPQRFFSEMPIKVIDFVLMARFSRLSLSRAFSVSDRKRALAALETCEVQRLRDRTIDTLSGGERQLVLIAAALAQDPQLLLLDEPTAYLDPLYQGHVLETLGRVRQDRGAALIMATHDINLAALNSERILALARGTICFDLRAGDFVSNTYLEAIYARKFALARHPELDQMIVLPDRV